MGGFGMPRPETKEKKELSSAENMEWFRKHSKQ